MSQWTYRNRSDHSQGGQLNAPDLRKMLEAEIVGDDHEFQPADSDEWLSAFKALKRLLEEKENETAEPIESRTVATDAPSSRDPRPKVRSKKKVVRKKADRSASPPPASAPSPPARPAVTPPLTRSSPPVEKVPTLGGFAVDSGGAEVRKASTRRRRQSDEEEEDLDITPMIDMTFLLLTFFMVTSTMDPVSSAELPPSGAGRMVETEGRIELFVQLPDDLEWDPDQPGAAPVTVDQLEIFLAESPEELMSLDELQTLFQSSFSNAGQSKLVLYAHRRMPSGIVNQITKMAQEAGARETAVGVTTPK